MSLIKNAYSRFLDGFRTHQETSQNSGTARGRLIDHKRFATIGTGIAALLAATVSGLTIADRFDVFDGISGSSGKPFQSVLWGAREEPLDVATTAQIEEFAGDYCVPASDPAIHTLLEVESPNDGLRISIRVNKGEVKTLLTTKRGFAVTDVLDGSPTYERPGKGQNMLFFPLQPGIGMEFGPSQSPERYRVILRGLERNKIRIGPEMLASDC